jgi:hypothetical protein
MYKEQEPARIEKREAWMKENHPEEL